MKLKYVCTSNYYPNGLAYAKPGDAGIDLRACAYLHDGERRELGDQGVYGIWDLFNCIYVEIPDLFTCIYVEIPDGFFGMVVPRSSSGITLANTVGIIDSGYRGEIILKIKSGPVIKAGDRIAQLIIMPYAKVEFEQVSELSQSDRGTGGFGSTGKS